jgi:hypothetical protein
MSSSRRLATWLLDLGVSGTRMLPSNSVMMNMAIAISTSVKPRGIFRALVRQIPDMRLFDVPGDIPAK